MTAPVQLEKPAGQAPRCFMGVPEAAPSITQELNAYGLPVTVGLGLIGAAGAGNSIKQDHKI